MNPHSLPHPCSRQLSHASEEECSDLSEMCGECVDVCVCGCVCENVQVSACSCVCTGIQCV